MRPTIAGSPPNRRLHKAVADDRDEIAAWGVLLLEKPAAASDPALHHRQQRLGHARDLHPLGLAVPGQVLALAAERGDAREAPRLATA